MKHRPLYVISKLLGGARGRQRHLRRAGALPGRQQSEVPGSAFNCVCIYIYIERERDLLFCLFVGLFVCLLVCLFVCVYLVMFTNNMYVCLCMNFR